jgi:hypothetical protein
VRIAKLFFLSLLTVASLRAQDASVVPPMHDPAPVMHGTQVPSNAVRGDVTVPATKLERARMQQGMIIWKRVWVRLPMERFDRRGMRLWLDNMTHPGPTTARNGDPDWLKYDPRGIRWTPHGMVFYAVAGDHIFYVVGSR